MLAPGPAKKLIVYISEQAHWNHTPAWKAIVDLLYRQGCAGATVTKAVAGFGARGDYHTSHIFSLREDVPMRIEMIETGEKIAELLPQIVEMASDGLIEVQETEIVK